MYYANQFGTSMPGGGSSDCTFSNPFSFAPSASSVFGCTGFGFGGGFADFSNPFSSPFNSFSPFGSFGGFGNSMPFSSPFDSPFGSNFGSPFSSNMGSPFDSPFDSPFSSSFGGFMNSPFNTSPQFGMFQTFNLFNMFNFKNRSNSSVNEPPGHVKQRNIRTPLSKQAKEQVAQIEKELNLEPGSLEKVMVRESGCNPHARNWKSKSQATGLIQFTKSTARRYGTTVDELIKMTAEEQMPYVRRYMKQAKRDAGYGPNDHLSAGEVYGLVLMPALIKHGGGYKAGTSNYSENRALDINDNGIINKYDLDKVMEGIHIKS